MNFKKVRELEGQKDAKGYQTKVQMFGTVQSAEDQKYNDNGKRYQQVHIADDDAETCKVKVWLGNSPEITQTQVRLSFDVGPNSFKGNMYYQGFWNSDASVDQSKAQAPSQPAGATNSGTVRVSNGNGTKDRHIVAQVTYKGLMYAGFRQQMTDKDFEIKMGSDTDMIMRVGAGQAPPEAKPKPEPHPLDPSDNPPDMEYRIPDRKATGDIRVNLTEDLIIAKAKEIEESIPF